MQSEVHSRAPTDCLSGFVRPAIPRSARGHTHTQPPLSQPIDCCNQTVGVAARLHDDAALDGILWGFFLPSLVTQWTGSGVEG